MVKQWQGKPRIHRLRSGWWVVDYEATGDLTVRYDGFGSFDQALLFVQRAPAAAQAATEYERWFQHSRAGIGLYERFPHLSGNPIAGWFIDCGPLLANYR